MNLTIRNSILTTAGISAIVFLVVYFLGERQSSIAYIDNLKLFNEFALKKELENDLKKKETLWKSQLDSMRIQISMLGKRIDSEKVSNDIVEKFEFTRQQYLAKEEQFKSDNERTAAQFNDQIWKQLNAYVQEFAKENEYDFVLGTSGEGNLMYGSENHNVTENAIAFVNQKYKGKN